MAHHNHSIHRQKPRSPRTVKYISSFLLLSPWDNQSINNSSFLFQFQLLFFTAIVPFTHDAVRERPRR